MEWKLRYKNTIVLGGCTLFLVGVIEAFNILKLLDKHIGLVSIKSTFTYTFMIIASLTVLTAIFELFRPTLLSKRFLIKIVSKIEQLLDYFIKFVISIHKIILWPLKILIVEPIVSEMLRNRNLGIKTIKVELNQEYFCPKIV